MKRKMMLAAKIPRQKRKGKENLLGMDRKAILNSPLSKFLIPGFKIIHK